MDDLVARLRMGTKFDCADKHAADDEIERLRQQRDEIRKLLELCYEKPLLAMGPTIEAAIAKCREE